MLRGIGDPLLVFLVLEIHQDSTIAKIRFCWKTSYKPIVLDPRKIQTDKNMPFCFAKLFGLVGVTDVLRFGIPQIVFLYFRCSKIYQDSTIVKSRFEESLVKRRLFGTRENNPEIIKISKYHPKTKIILCFVVGIGTIFASIHSCFFDRYWSHIQDF